MYALATFQQNRRYIQMVVDRLSDEQMVQMPAGFDNHIAWNVGHLVTVQQSLLYRLSGLKTVTTRDHVRLFAPGTSPAEWTEPPNLNEIRYLLKESTARMMADAQAGAFQRFRPYTTATGFALETFADAIAFNLYHEGLHFGTILSIRNVIQTT